MHRQRSRGRARLGRLVDDAHLHAKMAEPQRQHQAGWPRPHDQDFDFWFRKKEPRASASAGRAKRQK
jgi:hypothetical protein